MADGLPDPFDEGDVLRVTFGNGEIRFQATCNTMSGSAEWDDGVLRVSQVGGTEMGCPGAGHEQDEWLIDFFTSSPGVHASTATTCRLATDDDEMWRVPGRRGRRLHPPPSRAHGRVLQLTGIEETDGDSIGMMVVSRRIKAWLQIDGGELRFHTGCNGGGGEM